MSKRQNLSVLREEVFIRAGGRCEWPGCSDLAEELAHLTHRGMGGSPSRNTASNCAALCARHHDCLDGRTALGTLRWELGEMLRAVIA